MYKCQIRGCGRISRAGDKRIVLRVPRPGRPGEVERELSVCRACATQSRMGLSIRQIEQTLLAKQPPPTVPEPVQAIEAAAPTKQAVQF